LCVGARLGPKQALDDAIAAALNAVSLHDVIGWFSHAGYLLMVLKTL
jgi:hypothetical protein